MKFMTLRAGTFGLSMAVALSIGGGAKANLVTNGSFEMSTHGTGKLGDNTNATGWTVTGYNFLYAAGTADTTGARGSTGGAVKLWGPGTGSNNGLPASSPDGGNFIAADGAYLTGPIKQTLRGLTVGGQYAVSFYWAGAQQSGFTGATTEQWKVSLGTQELDTATLNDPSRGFTGWQHTTLRSSRPHPARRCRSSHTAPPPVCRLSLCWMAWTSKPCPNRRHWL